MWSNAFGMSEPTSDTVEPIVRELMKSGIYDWVSLHDVVWWSTEGDRSSSAKQRTLDVLRHLFTHNLMVLGDLGETGFEEWTGSHEEWERRAVADLERLSWSPTGDGFWLRVASD